MFIMNKPGGSFNKSKEEQRKEFLSNLILHSTNKITDNWLRIAKKLWCEKEYKKTIENNQNYVRFFWTEKDEEVLVQNKKSNEIKNDIAWEEDTFDSYDFASEIAENIGFFKKETNVNPNLDEYIEELENLILKKASDYKKSIGWWSLSEEDLKSCFDLACTEFSSLHPLKKDHSYLFSVVSDRFFGK